ncbi:beta strand repeat-containing protein [Rhodopseudomonas sp. RCAM05734]|uniref:beta strand repeat-containing protein n=1 Tax=Rhodopseudomonas sp. RCAM05734 TaxID=3457549 RepID=UPI0040449FD4
MQRPASLSHACASRRDTRQRAVMLATTALTGSLMIGQALAQTLPTGGSVAAGRVAIASPSSTQLNVTQTSPSAVVNWQSFSIGHGAAVTIQQPGSTSALLNRVTGDTPSSIAGSLTANGQVYLVNPNGIAITSTGTVNTGGGFVASTLGISDADFLSGKRSFTGNGASAEVSNAGTITVGRGGYAALIGGTVSNAGSIFVPLGKVGLGSGESATLDFSGDGFLQVALPTAAGGTNALIRNAGSIKADGGSVIISAATAREAARNAVNISGLVQAGTIGGRTGAIFIGGGAGGGVNISGKLIATSRQASGGAIAVTGHTIALEGASIDASGATGGGTINIGGGRQGEGALQRAHTLTVDAQTTIRADATTSGNGGAIVLWSDQPTRFAGTITARGGASSGNGGEAEVSGKAQLAYTGFTDLSAAHGSFGTLLLDPYNVIISNGADTGGFDATSNDSVINATTLMTALGAANVTITTGSGGTQAGNITVAAPLTWSAPTVLGLNAAGAIVINAPIAITAAGGLALNATAQAGITNTGLTFGNNASVDFGAIDHGGTFSLNGTTYTLVYTMAQLDAIDALDAIDGSALAQYGTGLSGNYALATNLSAAGPTYTRALIGTNSSNDVDTQYTGRFDGLGHTVTDLTINAPGLAWVGLLGYVNGAESSVSNIRVVGGTFTAKSNVAPLVGWLNGGVVQNSFASATVASLGTIISTTVTDGVVQSRTADGVNAGGLVGFNTGLIQSSHASSNVTGYTATGGLLGWGSALSLVTNSYATGTVSGINSTGGLAGTNGGMVTNSYATATVSGIQNTAGLVGTNTGTIQTSYATGSVSATGNRIGGLVGQNPGTIRASYATGAVSGTTNSGGLVGLNSPTGSVDSSYATGTVTGTVAVGGLVGGNNSTVPNVISNSYWDTQTSGISAAAGGGIGLTTAQLQGILPTAFGSSVWSTGAGLYPYLSWQFAAGSTPQAVSGIAYQADGAALAGATIAGTLSGTALATIQTGANGYYYFLLPQGSTSIGSGLFVDIAGNAVKSNAYVSGVNPTQNLDLNANTLTVRTAATTLSSVASSLASVIGITPTGDLVFSTPGGVLTANGGTSVSIAASGAFTVDQTLAVADAVRLSAAGSLTIAATGSVSSTSSDVTLAGSSFVNQRGADAVSAANGRWLVYSADPSNDGRGGLAYAFKQYAAIYGVTAVAQATGNGFLYSVAPTVTPTVSKTYDGGTGATLASTASGLDGDVIGLSYTTAAYDNANAGTGKTVTVNGLTMTSATNGGATVYGYTLGATTGTIAARAVTVTADAQSKVYGDANPALTYTVGGSGLVNGDSLSGSLTSGATTASGVGSYGITLGTLANSNYALTYAAANLTVTARAITVTADAQSRAYGDANPALTYTVGGSGLVNGDSLSGSLASSATAATGVGSYGITLGTLANSNYALTYAAANLTVTARAITLTADAQSRAYGDANPALSYTVGGSGLVNGDSLSGSLVTAAASDSAAGAYAIAQGTLINGRNPNYAIAYTGANLVVNAAPAPATTVSTPPTTTTASSTETSTVAPFVVAPADTSTTRQSNISFQIDQRSTTIVTPLAGTPTTAVSTSGSATRSAARRTSDDDIVTGSIGPQTKRKKKPAGR